MCTAAAHIQLLISLIWWNLGRIQRVYKYGKPFQKAQNQPDLIQSWLKRVVLRLISAAL
jgi:hypothetical protein